MIGIYKITNKLNGKSYIGQSIHCGKRLDEHYTGNQFIDETIQFEGIENFTYEILETCTKTELSFWEDYYIYKYNTMFPNGYNKRWNCSEKLRSLFIINQEQNNLITNNTQIDDILLCDEDIDLLKRAIYVQKTNFNKNRICSEQELKDFYKRGQAEANHRKIISLNEIILKNDIQLTEAQKRIFNDIYWSIEQYNQKRVLWHLCDMDAHTFNQVKENSYMTLQFNKEYYQQQYKEIGLPCYSRYSITFTKEEIKIQIKYDRLVELRPWKTLFEKQILNKNRISFYDENGKLVDINNIKHNQELKKLIEVVIK